MSLKDMNEKIEELLCGSNFSYVLEDSGLFFSTYYKVLQNQGNSNFIKCMKMQFNGKIQIYYLTNGLRPFSAMLPQMTDETFFVVVKNLLRAVLDVKSNGFLSICNIVIEADKIYVDPTTLKVKLVYMPLTTSEYESDIVFESELRTSLVKLINNSINFSSGKIIQLSKDLANGMLSLEELCARMVGGEMEFTGAVVHREVTRNAPVASRPGKKLGLVSINAPEHVEFEVNKPEYVFGKNSAMVDGAITFNKAISRVHCKINNSDGNFYVTDLQSANGTYLNGIRLQPNQAHPVSNGDVVRLANMDFRISIV